MLTSREDDAEETRRLESLSRGVPPSPRLRGISMRYPTSKAAWPFASRTCCTVFVFLLLIVLIGSTSGQYSSPRVAQGSRVADAHITPRADGRCTTLRRLMRTRRSATTDFATCDPSAAALPCCSAMGHCGSTEDHCKCSGCIDYRNIISPQLSKQVARARQSAQRVKLRRAARHQATKAVLQATSTQSKATTVAKLRAKLETLKRRRPKDD